MSAAGDAPSAIRSRGGFGEHQITILGAHKQAEVFMSNEEVAKWMLLRGFFGVLIDVGQQVSDDGFFLSKGFDLARAQARLARQAGGAAQLG